MANARQSRATGPLFFLKSGCPNKVLVVSANRQLLISSTADGVNLKSTAKHHDMTTSSPCGKKVKRKIQDKFKRILAYFTRNRQDRLIVLLAFYLKNFLFLFIVHSL